MNVQKKHIHGGVILASILVLGTLTFLLYRNNKKRYANIIIKTNGTSGSLPWLLSLDEGYLAAWAKGLKAGKDTFAYNGASYHTQGGTKIVAAGSPAPSTNTTAASNPISSNPYNLL